MDKRVKDPRNERPQLFYAIRLGDQEDYAHHGRAKVLLKFEILVNRDQRIELFGEHESQQFAVALRGPAHVDDVPDLVSDEVELQRAGDALIEQKPHALRSSPGQAQAQRQPAFD